MYDAAACSVCDGMASRRSGGLHVILPLDLHEAAREQHMMPLLPT